jgi:hypothetical protein
MDGEKNKVENGCCGPMPIEITTFRPPVKTHWTDGIIKTPGGNIPRVSTRLISKDRWRSWKVRWGMGRMSYAINPGLYAVGSPTPESPVFVTANYKLSFDCLRSDLDGRDGWILVLDTKAVNVWCAAGKGTFGTEELIRRIGLVRLKDVVSHRQLILPQLSATGVSAPLVKKLSDFRVIFGPVRSADLRAFLDSGLKATPEMRRVRFPFKDRIALAPIEIVGYAKYALPLAVVFFLLSGLGRDGYSITRLLSDGSVSALLVAAAWIGGAVLTPALLPILPGRAFSAKGAGAGLILWLMTMLYFQWQPAVFPGWVSVLGSLFIFLPIASFLGMNFTGSSTYTSLSGVKKEMRYAVPLQITAAVLGAGLWITGLFVKG